VDGAIVHKKYASCASCMVIYLDSDFCPRRKNL